MDIELLPETGDSGVTLQNLRKYISAGYKVKGCKINEDASITVIFDKGEYHAVGFKVGKPCRPFAEFVVEVGLDKRVDLVEWFLEDMPEEIITKVGVIKWPGFSEDDERPERP